VLGGRHDEVVDGVTNGFDAFLCFDGQPLTDLEHVL